MEILSEKEYDALDYHMTKARLYESGLYIQQEPNRGDYFVDEENNCEYSLEEGLEIIFDTFVGEIFKEYPSWVRESLNNLYLNRFGVYI